MHLYKHTDGKVVKIQFVYPFSQMGEHAVAFVEIVS